MSCLRLICEQLFTTCLRLIDIAASSGESNDRGDRRPPDRSNASSKPDVPFATCRLRSSFANNSDVVGAGAWGVFFALQLAPSPVQPLVRSTTDPRVHVQIAGHPEVGAILDRSCKDCHSNQTHVPWYGHVAPVSWMLSQHVNQGREMLNFSDWDSRQPTANEMEELCDAVSSGSMPLGSYTLIHRKCHSLKA